MFNDKYSLTQAVLDGRKTMTRRIIKPQPQDCSSRHKDYIGASWKNEPMHLIMDENNYAFCKYCGYGVDYYKDKGLFNALYKVGEVVAIAQSYESLGMNPEIALNDRDRIGFYTKTKFAPGWKNKMFVRADLMPHHIRITNIKIERLQDISDEDCLREGVELNTRQYEYDGTKKYCVCGLGHWRAIGCTDFDTPREAFAALIDKVSGKGTWESNPYVFVYEFELID